MIIEKATVLFGSAFLVLLSSSGIAHAYLDGGTASLLIQALVGGIAAAGVVLIGIRQKIAAFFGKADKHAPEDASPAGPAGDKRESGE